VAIGRAAAGKADRRDLLLSILEHDDSLAASILRALGAEPGEIRRRLA
jgi:hypothetical protein